MSSEFIKFLEHKAYCMRVHSIRMTTQAGSGHVTSALSAADLVAALFFGALRFDPQNPRNPNNDRFILSKGHADPIVYAAWRELGVLQDQELVTYRQFTSVLEGHPTPRFSRTEAATGSLGQGLSIGLGMSLAARLDNRDYRIWVLMGDSEVAEGSVWEAAQLAVYYEVNNLVAILDVNRLGQTGPTMQADDVSRHQAMWQGFGWRTIVVDGHDIKAIMHAYEQAQTDCAQPTIIIARTIKGYGVKEVEDQNGFHGHAFTKEEEPAILHALEQRFYAAAHYELRESFVPSVPIDKVQVKLAATGTLSSVEYPLNAVVSMRQAYGQALAHYGTFNQDIVCLDAEVKNSTFAEIFQAQHPLRFFQCFIAEQNMIGMAVGMAARGKHPFCSTFSSFISRAYDQIRMASIGRVACTIVGSHAGVTVGQDGPSQMGLEDIAILRAVPDSVVVHPCDAVSTTQLVMQLANYKQGIGYLRLLRPSTPVIYGSHEEFHIGGCKVLRQYQNAQACIVAAGYTVFEALKAHDLLLAQGIKVAVIDLYSIKPFDVQTVLQVAQQSNNCVVTVEDHYLEGGMGQAVAYGLRNQGIRITCLAVTRLARSGLPEELLAYEGIDAQALVELLTLEA